MKRSDPHLDLNSKWKARPHLDQAALFHEVSVEDGAEFIHDLLNHGYSVPVLHHAQGRGLLVSVFDSSLKRHELFCKTEDAATLWNQIKKALQDEFTNRHARI